MKNQKDTIIMMCNISECGDKIRRATGVEISDRQLLGEHSGDTIEHVIELHKKGFSILPTTEFLRSL